MSLIVIVFSLIAMVNKNKKKQQKTQERRPVSIGMEPNAPKAVTTPAAPAQPATMLPPRPEAKKAEAVRMSIDDFLAQPSDKNGSMEGKTDHSAHVSCEGHDPCHEEQLRPAVRPSRAAPAAAGTTVAFREEEPALSLNFSGDELVRAFVMQEVLTRPCERVRRIGCR